MGRCSFHIPAAQESVAEAIHSASQAAGASYIDSAGWFCYDSVCPEVVDHTIVYFDPGHISASYAAALASVFRTTFLKAIGQRSA